MCSNASKVLVIIICWVVSHQIVFAQDQIQKKNGENFPARVLSLKGDKVLYVRTNDPDFTILQVSKGELKQIRMENGTVYNYEKTTPGNYIGFSLGPCFPLGDLRKKSYEDAKGMPGYVGTGFSPKIDLGIYVKKNFGLCLHWSLFNMSINEDAIKEDILNGSSEELEVFFTDKSDTKKTKYHSFVTIGIGAMYTLVKNKHAVDFKLTRGIIKLDKQSAHEHRVFNPNDTLTRSEIIRGFDTKSQGYWSPGIAYRYEIGKNFSARVCVDFMAMNMAKKYDVSVNGLSGTSTDANSFTIEKQRFGILSLGLGLVFHF